MDMGLTHMGLLDPLLGGNFSFTPNHFSNTLCIYYCLLSELFVTYQEHEPFFYYVIKEKLTLMWPKDQSF